MGLGPNERRVDEPHGPRAGPESPEALDAKREELARLGLGAHPVPRGLQPPAALLAPEEGHRAADAGGDVLFSRDTFFLQLLLDMVVSDMVLLLWL